MKYFEVINSLDSEYFDFVAFHDICWFCVTMCLCQPLLLQQF